MKSLKSFWRWLTLADYDARKEASTDQIIRRLSRNNVSVQNGFFVDERECLELSRRADRAMRRLNAKSKSSNAA